MSKGDYPLEKFYAFCEVHFDRSECRVRRKNAVVPVQRKDEFKQRVRMLKEEMERVVFDEQVASLKSDFKNCTKWLNWYLHIDRAKCIFPAVANEEFAGDCHNTNAQESMGRTIQLTCEQDNPSIAQTYFHLYKLANKIDFKYSCAVQGNPTSYGKRRAKRSRTNDGRAPDSDKTLFDTKKKRTGRQKKAANLAPSGNQSIDLTCAIPWSFAIDTPVKVRATITCAMDSCLMALFLLRKYDDELYLDFIKDKKMQDVLNLIHARRYDKA